MNESNKQFDFDFLNYKCNSSIKRNMTRDEEIIFSDKVQKVNGCLFKKERNIILTNKAIYDLKKSMLKLRIDYKLIKGITTSKLSDEIIVHTYDVVSDYYISSPKKKIIIKIVAENFQLIIGEEINLFLINVNNLECFVTKEKEKKIDMDISRMPKTGRVSVKEYCENNETKNE